MIIVDDGECDVAKPLKNDTLRYLEHDEWNDLIIIKVGSGYGVCDSRKSLLSILASILQWLAICILTICMPFNG